VSAVPEAELTFKAGTVYTVNDQYAPSTGWDGQRVLIPFDQSPFQSYIRVVVLDPRPGLHPDPLPDGSALFTAKELTPA
jgi:hypothetical protein